MITVFLLLTVAGPLQAAATSENQDVWAYNLAHGRVVFTENCAKCHEEGDKGAPVLENTVDWQPRIEQTLSTLIEHAIEGHGDMPAKGDFDNLSAQDVASAVAYVVYRVRLLVMDGEASPDKQAGSQKPPATCRETEPWENCTAEDASDSLLLKMFWLLTNRER